MKVLLIQPPVRVDHDPVNIPRGLGYLSSISIQEGHQTAFMDLNATRPHYEDVARQMAVETWDVIGIGGLSSMYKDIKKILKIARRLNPNALIACGGGFITYMPDRIMRLNSEIDVAAIGEGEETFRDILKTTNAGGSWKNVKGICYRDSGQIIYTEPRPLISNMDTIPMPAYDLMDLDTYFKYSNALWYNGAWKSKARINFVTERGCPRQCTFCTHNGMNRWDQLKLLGKEKVKLMDQESGFQPVVRFFSPKYVVNEALYVTEKYGVDYVVLDDENLTSNNKRVHEFCDEWIEAGLHKIVKLGTWGDAPSLNKEVLEHMKEAGFTFFSIGGESGSDRVLKEDIKKGVTVAHNQRAIDLLRQSGIQPIMTFMVGNPHEDINDVLETVDFMTKNNIEINPFICTPYPGTQIFMDDEDFVLGQYDERLALLKKLPHNNIQDSQVSKWRDEALEKYLLSLNDASDFSCTVSRVFDFGDLLAIKYLMSKKDVARLLQLAHIRGWKHVEKWNKKCPVCNAKEELSIKLISK